MASPRRPSTPKLGTSGRNFGQRSSKPRTSSGAVLGVKILGQPHVENQQRHGGAEDSIVQGVEAGFENTAIPDGLRGHLCKNIKLFQCLARCSIDFGQFDPMFRFDAARYRNAIS